jgi:hypothetical protein
VGNVSAAHVSATLAKAGYPRAVEPSRTDSGIGDSGFVVSVGDVETLGPTVIVGYQDYQYGDRYEDWCVKEVARRCGEAFDGYTQVLHQHGYTVENWMRYDGVRLGLFVTGREG